MAHWLKEQAQNDWKNEKTDSKNFKNPDFIFYSLNSFTPSEIQQK